MSDFIKNHRGFLLGSALLVMTLAAYLPAMRHGGFIWDDESYIINNKTLRDIPGLIDIWTDPEATPQYYPLVHTSYWIEYHLWGLDPTGYHVNNVLLHALGAILLWRVLKRLRIPGAWLAAALFAVHPVNVESAAWITERKNVLSIVFYLGAALAFIKWADAKEKGERKPSGYILAFVLYICALLSKTVTASLPAALLLVAWWKNGIEPATGAGEEKKGGNRLFKWLPPLIPFFTAGLLLSGLTVWLEKHHVGAKGAEWNLSLIDRCLVAGRALWFYIGKLLWPSKLCFNYPRWDIDATAWWQYLFPLAFAALLVLLWVFRKRIGRGPLVALLFFAGTLFPALGFLDVYPFRYSFVADHFQYLASIGILTLIATGIAKGLNRLWESKKRWGWRLAGILPVAALFGALVIVSAHQCGIYRDLETLWFDTIDKNPNAWMAYNNLGMLYLGEGRPAAAIPYFQKTLALNPKEMKAYSNLGAALARLGRFDEAMTTYQKAIEIDPDDPMAYNNLGAAYARRNLYKKAITYYEKALALDPDLAATHINLAAGLASLGRFEEAIMCHGKALELAPDFAPSHLRYGETLQLMGRLREAAEQYRQALKLDPTLAVAHIHLGEIALKEKLAPAAVDHFRQAVKLAPRLPETNSNLAKVLAATGRVAEAGRYFNRAVALKPQSGTIRFDYATFLAQHGQPDAARREFLETAKLMPKNPDPLFQAGVMDMRLRDMKDAATRFRAVLALAPNHAPACNHLAVLLAGQGKNTEAIDLLQKAVKLQPENAEFHNNLGVILVRAGRRAEALKALETAVRLKPDYAEAEKNLNDLKKLMETVK